MLNQIHTKQFAQSYCQSSKINNVMFKGKKASDEFRIRNLLKILNDLDAQPKLIYHGPDDYRFFVDELIDVNDPGSRGFNGRHPDLKKALAELCDAMDGKTVKRKNGNEISGRNEFKIDLDSDKSHYNRIYSNMINMINT